MITRPDEVLILTDDTCESCTDLKGRLVDVALVRFLPLDSEEANGILGDQEEVFVPLAVARFGERRRVCPIGQEGDQVVLVCDGEIIHLKE